MPNKPSKRRSTKTKDKDFRGTMAKLLDIEPYHRNEITLRQINTLRDLVDLIGCQQAAKEVGVCDTTLLRVCAGFGHKLRPQVVAKIREYLKQ